MQYKTFIFSVYSAKSRYPPVCFVSPSNFLLNLSLHGPCSSTSMSSGCRGAEDVVRHALREGVCARTQCRYSTIHVLLHCLSACSVSAEIIKVHHTPKESLLVLLSELPESLCLRQHSRNRLVGASSKGKKFQSTLEALPLVCVTDVLHGGAWLRR